MVTSTADKSGAPTLAFWLFLMALVACVLTVGTAFLAIDGLFKHHERLDAQELLRTNAAALRDALDEGMEQHFQQVKVLAELDQVAQTRSTDEMRRALDSYRAKFPQYAWLGVVAPDGMVLASSQGLLQGLNVAKRDWFQAGLTAPSVGDVHQAMLLAKLLPQQAEPWRFVDFSVPVVRDGQTVAVLGAHLSWTWAGALKSMLAERLAQSETEVLVLGSKGEVLLGPKALEGKPFDLAAEQANPDVVVSVYESRGHGDFKGLGWRVVIRQPEQVAMSGYRSMRIRTGIAAIAVCVLVAPGLWLVARRLSRPLHELTRWLDSPNNQPLNWSAPYREARILGDALRDFRFRQQSYTDQLRGLAEQLETRVTERTAELAEAKDRLEASRTRLAAILEHSPDGFIAMDGRGLVTDWNSAAEQMFGFGREEAKGRLLSELIVPPDRRAGHDGGMVAFGRTGEGSVVGQCVEVTAQHRDGSPVPIELSVGAIKHPDGYVAFGFLRDIRERRAAQAELAASQRQMRAVTDNLPMMISYIDSQRRLQFTNLQFEHWTGVKISDALGRPLQEVIGEQLYAQRREQLTRALAGERVEFEVRSTAIGTDRWLQTVYVPDVDANGVVNGVYALTTDVTPLRQAERQMAELAMNDTLTGLPNRRSFNQHLPQALARAARTGAATALLFLDVDHFKAINDTHGHAAGDEVLQVFARRIAGAIRASDMAARFAGDEFVVVLESVKSRRDVELVAEKLTAVAREPVRLQTGALLRTSTSIGAVHADAELGLTPEQLLAAADQALYKTKQNGRDGFTVVSVSEPPNAKAA
jgi:diguanylate cyclase (GGDEF)-like protein/PAS domain S-box-containing protein